MVSHSPGQLISDELPASARTDVCRVCEDNLMSFQEQKNGVCKWCIDEIVFGIEQPDFEAYHLDLGRKSETEWVNSLAKDKEVKTKRGSKRKKTFTSAALCSA